VEELDVEMRDGVKLKADHYAPTDGSNKGTVLVRGPYSRVGLPAIVYARPFVTHGYHVVIQNCRGTFGSGGGDFVPGVAEHEDGQDTLTWLRKQRWYTGRFATFGGSYLGFTQWGLMRDAPEDLAAAVVLVGPNDLSRLAWRNGAFRLSDMLRWSEDLAWQEETGELRGIIRSLRVAKRHAPVCADVSLPSASNRLLKGRSSWFTSWLQHPDPADDFWSSTQVSDALVGLDVPVLLHAGWQDVILEQNLQQWATLSKQSPKVALTVGPWKHGPDLALKGGATIVSEALQWIDQHLGDAESGKRDAAVHVQLRGDKGWRSLPDWPPAAEPMTLFLHDQGALSSDLPAEGAATTALTYDPTRPTQATGGAHLSAGSGYQDCQHIDARADVATFTGAVLTEPLVIAGTVVVELAHSCASEIYDVYVRLSEVDAKGRSIHVCDGFVRLDRTRKSDPLRLELTGTAYRFAQGSRVRLAVAGGAHPVYARPVGPDGSVLAGSHLSPQTHTISHEAGRTSSVVLPIVSWD
jgi:putative CocE/NonD family hydrolase